MIKIFVPGNTIVYAELFQVCLYAFVDMGTKWMSNSLIKGEQVICKGKRAKTLKKTIIAQ